MKKDITYFAKVNYRDDERVFGIKQRDRFYHTYMIGQTGTGKTTCMQTMMMQDIINHRGCCLIDPHGDLAQRIHEAVPDHRKEDVIYLNLPDPNFTWGYNPIRKVSKEVQPLLVAGIISVFEHLFKDAWGARIEHILRYVLLVLLQQPQASIADMLNLLQDKGYRKQALTHVHNKEVRTFWEKEYLGYPPYMVAPVLNKIGAFMAYPKIKRLMIDNTQQLRIRHIIDSGKILLVNLSHGQIGSDPAHLIGSLLITSLGLAAFSRANIPEKNRKPFFIYADEFQHFTGSNIANLLSELRKFKVGMVLAHQYIEQLSPEIRKSVLGNVGTIICFRLGALDAPLVSREMGGVFRAEDIMYLPNYHIYLKLMIDGVPSRGFSGRTIT